MNNSIQIAIYNILYVNDLACACVIDMQDKVKGQDKETQKIYRALSKRRKFYESSMNEILGKEIDFCAEYNYQMDEIVHDKVFSMYQSIYEYLKRNNVENSEFIALAEMAYTIIGYSVQSIDNRIKECIPYNKAIVNMRNYKLMDMMRISGNLCDWLTRKLNGIDLNQSEEIKEAYKSLDKTLTNINIISNSVNKASEYVCS